MRYLYGDSAPFPLQYNFLSTLEHFVTYAARAAQLRTEIAELEAANASAAAARAGSVAKLDTVHRAAVRTVREAAVNASDPLVVDYIAQVTEFAARTLENARREAESASERDQMNARGANQQRREELRAAIESFMLASRLQTLAVSVALRLIDGKHELAATVENPDGIGAGYALAIGRVSAWQAPRRVADFAQGIEVRVGMRKTWLSRTEKPEVVKLDEFYVSGFEADEDAAEIRLRRKPDAKDTLVFNLAREGASLLGEVTRPGDEGGGLPMVLEPEDRPQLEKLWQLIRASLTEALEHRERVTAVTLDGHDVFGDDQALPFVERVVRLMAPTVAQIARRSPSPEELSLKCEDDSGRREEVYLKKSDLRNKLTPLSARAKRVFAPFALEPRSAGEVDDVSEVEGLIEEV